MASLAYRPVWGVRKSGMLAAVEIPAPTRATIRGGGLVCRRFAILGIGSEDIVYSRVGGLVLLSSCLLTRLTMAERYPS